MLTILVTSVSAINVHYLLTTCVLFEPKIIQTKYNRNRLMSSVNQRYVNKVYFIYNSQRHQTFIVYQLNSVNLWIYCGGQVRRARRATVFHIGTNFRLLCTLYIIMITKSTKKCIFNNERARRKCLNTQGWGIMFSAEYNDSSIDLFQLDEPQKWRIALAFFKHEEVELFFSQTNACNKTKAGRGNGLAFLFIDYQSQDWGVWQWSRRVKGYTL